MVSLFFETMNTSCSGHLVTETGSGRDIGEAMAVIRRTGFGIGQTCDQI